jgi:hypothetical protein
MTFDHSDSTKTAAVALALAVALPAPDDPDVLALLQFLPRVERRVGGRTIIAQPAFYMIDEVTGVGPYGLTRVYHDIAAGRLIATAVGDSSRRAVTALNLARWFVWIERAGAVNAKAAARAEELRRGPRGRRAEKTSAPAAPPAEPAPKRRGRRSRPTPNSASSSPSSGDNVPSAAS